MIDQLQGPGSLLTHSYVSATQNICYAVLLNVSMYLRGLYFSINQCCKTSELIPLADGL